MIRKKGSRTMRTMMILFLMAALTVGIGTVMTGCAPTNDVTDTTGENPNAKETEDDETNENLSDAERNRREWQERTGREIAEQPAPAPLIADEPENPAIYRNTEFGFELTVPEGWNAETMPMAESEYGQLASYKLSWPDGKYVVTDVWTILEGVTTYEEWYRSERNLRPFSPIPYPTDNLYGTANGYTAYRYPSNEHGALPFYHIVVFQSGSRYGFRFWNEQHDEWLNDTAPSINLQQAVYFLKTL